MPITNSYGDKMTRDVRQTLKALGTAPGRYFKGTAKLFLASGSEIVKADMPGLSGMIDVNKDVIVDASRFLRNPVDAISRGVSRAIGGESFQALKKLATNAIDDLKTGNFYDKDRDRSKYGQEVDDLLNNFGGFDMTAFDSNGDYNPSKSKLNQAGAMEESADQRMGIEIQALGLSTSAITGTLNANASNDMRIGLKQHGQKLNAMQNITVQQGAILQSVNSGFSSILEVMRESHQETQGKLDSVVGLLGEIRDGVAPPKVEDQDVSGNDFLGGRGELDIKRYIDAVKKNADDRFGISGAISMMTGGRTIAELVDLFGNNPLELIATPLLEHLVPDSLKEQMKTTEKYVENFFPALMAKLSDRGRRFEEATTDNERNFSDLVAGIFGVKPRIMTGIDTSVEDVSASAALSVKTVKAIEEVIPAQLSMIYSAVSGKELMLFDYRAGKFVSAASTVARETHDANDLAGNMGTAAWNFRNRIGQFKFENPEWDEEFDDYVYEWFNNLAKKGLSIDYNQSRKDFMDDMPGRDSARKDAYYDAIVATLREMPRDDYMALNAELYKSRLDQMTRHAQQMKDLRDSGLDIAYANVMDPSLMSEIEDKTKKTRYGMWDYDVYNEIDKARLDNVRSGIGLSVGDTANSILSVLQKGIVTFTHIISDDTDIRHGRVPEGMRDVLHSQRLALDIASRKEHARMEAQENKLYWEHEAKAERKASKEDQDHPMRDTVVGIGTTQDVYRAIQRDYSNVMMPAGRSENPHLEEQRRIQDSQRFIVTEAQKLKQKYGIDPDGTFFDNLRGAVGKAPFALVEDSLKAADDIMFKILYGEDAPDLKGTDEDTRSLFKVVGTAIQTHFIQAKDWFLENIGGPLKEFFFGKEGLFPRLKSTFSDKVITPLADKAKAFGAELKTKAIGTEVVDERGNGTGVYEGGWFSDQYNRIKTKSSDTIGEVGGIVTGAFEQMLHGDEDDEYGGLIGKFKKAGDSLNQTLFGEDANGDDHQSKEKFNFLKREINNALPEMTIGAGIGLITSFFLPGGPLLGILTGMGGGLLSASESLKSYLFGEKFIKEKVVIGSDGNPVMVRDPKTKKMVPKTRVYESRKGSMIDSEIYDGLKQYLPKTGIGAGVGWLVGQGIFPGIGGAIGGALIGSLGGMIASSDRLKRILFGDKEDDTGESGIFSKNFRENLLNAFVGHGGGMVIGRIAGGALGLLAQGILPGGIGIFAHQLFATLGSTVGLISGPKIMDWIFGEEQEVEVKDPKSGKKIKKKARMGGLFGKVYDDAKENLVNPLAERINAVGHKISSWFNDSIVTPFTHAMEPAKQAMRDAADSIRSSIRNIGEHIKESLDNIFDKAIGMPLGDFMREKVIKPLDSAVSKFFGFIGRVIGNVISAPFKALEFLTTGEVSERSRSEIKRDNRIAKMNEKLQARRNKITAKELAAKRKGKRADDSVTAMKLVADTNKAVLRSDHILSGYEEEPKPTKGKDAKKSDEAKLVRPRVKKEKSERENEPIVPKKQPRRDKKTKPKIERSVRSSATNDPGLPFKEQYAEPENENTPEPKPPLIPEAKSSEESSKKEKEKVKTAKPAKIKTPKVGGIAIGRIAKDTGDIAKDVHGIKLMLSKAGISFISGGKSSSGGSSRSKKHKGIIGTIFGLASDVVSAGISLISVPFKALGISADAVTKVFGTLANAGTSLLGFITKTAVGTVSMIGSTLVNITGGIVKTITSVLGFIPNTLAGIVNAISGVVKGATSAVGGIVGGITSAVGSVIGGALKAAGSITKGTIDALTFVPRAILGVAGGVVKTGLNIATAPIRLLTGGGKHKKEVRKAREQGRIEGRQQAKANRQYKSAPSISSSIISQLPMVKTDYGDAIRVFIAGQGATRADVEVTREERKMQKEALKEDRRLRKEQRKAEKREKKARRWAPLKSAVRTAVGMGWSIAGGVLTQKASEWIGDKLGLKGTRFWTDVVVPIGFGDKTLKGTTTSPLIPIAIRGTNAIPVYVMGHYGDGKAEETWSEAPINEATTKRDEEKKAEPEDSDKETKPLIDKFTELTDTFKKTGDRIGELVDKLSERDIRNDAAPDASVPSYPQGSLEWIAQNAKSEDQFRDWVAKRFGQLSESSDPDRFKNAPVGSLEWIFGNAKNDKQRDAWVDSVRSKIPRAASGITNAQAGPSVVGEHGREVIWNDRKPKAKVVGENGPEVVNLEPGDNVIPNHKLPSNMRGDTLKRFASGTDPKPSAAERLKRQAAKSAVDTAGNIGKGVLSVASLPFMGAYGIGKGVVSAYKNRAKIAAGARNIGTKVSLGMSSAEEQFINDLKAMQPQVNKDIQPYGEEVDDLIRELREKFIPDNLPDAMNIMDDAKLKAAAIGLRYGGIMPDRTGWDTDKRSKFDAIFDYFDRKDAEREARREDMLGAYADDVEKYGWIRATGGRALKGGLKAAMWASFWPMLLPFTMTRKLLTLGKAHGKKRMKRLSRKEYKELNAIQKFRYNKNRHGLGVAGGLAGLGAIKRLARPALPLFGAATKIGGSFTKLAGKYIGGAGDKLIDISRNGFGIKGPAGQFLDTATWIPRKLGGIYGYGAKGIGAVTGGMGSGMRGLGLMISGEPQRAAKRTLNAAGEATRDAIEKKAAEIRQGLKDKPLKSRFFEGLHSASETGKKAGGFFGKFIKKKADGTPGSTWDDYVNWHRDQNSINGWLATSFLNRDYLERNNITDDEYDRLYDAATKRYNELQEMMDTYVNAGNDTHEIPKETYDISIDNIRRILGMTDKGDAASSDISEGPADNSSGIREVLSYLKGKVADKTKAARDKFLLPWEKDKDGDEDTETKPGGIIGAAKVIVSPILGAFGTIGEYLKAIITILGGKIPEVENPFTGKKDTTDSASEEENKEEQEKEKKRNLIDNFREFKKKYLDIDRKAERSSNAADEYDKEVAKAKTPEEIEAVKASQQMNINNEQIEENEEKEKKGGLLTTILGGLSGILSLIPGLGGAASAISGIAGSMVTGATTAIPAIIGGAKAAVGATAGFTGTALGGLLGAVGTGKALVTGDIGHAAAYGTRTVTGIASKFISFFAKASTKLLSMPAVENLVVKVLGSGATSGLSGALRNAVGKWVNGAASGALATLGTKLAKVNVAVMVATAAADVITGVTHASEHFNVMDSEVTEGMRLAAGLAKGLSGLAFGLIPVDWFAQFLWKLFASQEEKEKLSKDQENYKARVAAFNKENGTNLSVEEFQRDYKEDGTKKTHFVRDTLKAAGGFVGKVVKDTFGGVLGVVGNFAGLTGKFITGDIKGLWQYDLTEHVRDDNPLKWLVAPATLVAKLGLLFPTMLMWIGKNVLFGVVKTVKNVVANGIGAIMGISDIGPYIIKGDPVGLLKYDPTERIASDKDSFMYPFAHVAFTGLKFGGLMLSLMSMAGHKLAGLIAPVFGGLENNASVFWTGSGEIFKLAGEGHPLQILGIPTSAGDGSPMSILFSGLGILVKAVGFIVGIFPALLNMIAKPFEWIGRKLGMIKDEYDEDGNIVEKKSLSQKVTGWLGKHLGPVGTFVDLMFNGAQTEEQQNATTFGELMQATSARGKAKPELPKPSVSYGTGPDNTVENVPDLKPLTTSNRKKSILDHDNLIVVGEGIGRGIVSSLGGKAKKIRLADVTGSVGASMANTFLTDMKRTEGSQATIGSSVAAGTAVAISESPQSAAQSYQSTILGSKIKSFANRIFGRGQVKPMSQRDPRWATDSNSMADDGCGPTAAAMVASAYGKGDPGEADRMSRTMGMRAPDGGTNPDFFGKYASTKGFGMKEGPVDSGRIQANLKRGQPVVMMGKGGEFGSGTHYLVADKAEGKSGIGFVDPLTGAHKSTSIESLGRNASTAVYSYGHGPEDGKLKSSGDSPDKSDSGRDDEKFGRGNYSTNEKVAAAQKNLWNAMKSKEKTLAYDQSYGKQDPDKGSASCASTVAWAYRKTLGVNPGGNSGFALSREQYKDPNFTRIYERKKGSPDPDLSKLQVGDIVYFKYNTPYFQPNSAKSLDHTEMYGGDGQDWSHGGSTAKSAVPKDSKGHQKGPKLYTVSASRKKSIMVINRYTPFMTGDGMSSVDATVGSSSDAEDTSAADTTTTASETAAEASTQTYESPLDFIKDLIGNVISPIKSAFVEMLGGKSSDSGTSNDTSASATSEADSGSTPAGETAASTAASAEATNKGKFPTYNLNDRELKGIANILGHEQGDQAGWEAEASLLANMVDQSGDKYATVKRLTDKATSGWFYQGKQRFNNPGAAKAGPIAAAKSVLVQGYRTLPRYVNEHDMLGNSKVSDIGSVSNDGKTFNKFDRSKYIPNKTIIRQDPNRFKGGGIKYTFYTFPSAKSDPFGYTSEAMRKKWGDDHYDVSTKRAAGKGPGDDEKTDKDTLSMMAAENDREPAEFGRGPEDTEQSTKTSPQQALVDRMKSIAGTIKYSTQNPVQNPDKGTASCASTVGWAYRKTLGVDGMSASSTEQSKDSRFTTIYENRGNGTVDPSILQPGDVMYYNWDRTSLGKDRVVQHTEMYAGNNQDWSHGGPSDGPVIKSLNDYRKKRLMIVRRYTPFLSGQEVNVNQVDGTTETTSTAEVDASGNTGSDAESPMDIIRDLMSKIKTGITEHFSNLFNGGGSVAEPVAADVSGAAQPTPTTEAIQSEPSMADESSGTSLGKGPKARHLSQSWGTGTADLSVSAQSVGDSVRRINSDITRSRKIIESELEKETIADRVTKAIESAATSGTAEGSGGLESAIAGIAKALSETVRLLTSIEGYTKSMSEAGAGNTASDINARYSGKKPDSPRYPNGARQLDDRGADIVRRMSMAY